MKPFQVFAGEFRRLVRSPMLIVTFIAVALVPILYSGFLIEGVWDPYGKLGSLPIAVVNLDEGADFEGKPRNIGQEFVAQLRDNAEFAWGFVSPEEAAEGMANNTYYASITVPADFSARAASLSGGHPEPADIVYESNSFYNFVAGQIGESLSKEMRGRLSESLTEAYSRSLLAQFESISAGFRSGAEGAAELQSGARSLSSGIARLKGGLAQADSGAGQLADKAGLLQSGASRLSAGVSDVSKGASDLASGASRLQAAGKQLEQGAGSLATGSSSLTEGMQASKSGADRLASGMERTLAAGKDLAAGLETSAASIGELAEGAQRVAAGLDRLIAAHPELASDADAQALLAAGRTVAQGSRTLNDGSGKLRAGSQALNAGLDKLVDGARSLSAGNGDLAQGAARLQGGVQQLQSGLGDFNSRIPSWVDGSVKLGKGAAEAARGAADLSGGMGQMAAGIGKVAGAVHQLNEGASALAEGAPKLEEGSGRLAARLQDAAEETAAIRADDATVRMLADPVNIVANDDRREKMYAKGIAPYFISIALFAGSLVFTTIYAARSTSVEGATRLRLLVGKLLVFGIVSVLQSLTVCTVLVFLLGFQVRSVPLFYAFTLVVGLTFMLLIQAVVTWLDQPGRFVVLLIMILQLASSAGTFPLELLPGWAQSLHPWLPMSYAIQGFRFVISSGQFGGMWHQAGYLGVYLATSAALVCAYFLTRKKGGQDERLMPVKV